MGDIFGETTCKFELGETVLQLQHTRMQPNFFKGKKIVHESVISEKGKRTYSRNQKFAEFEIEEYLFLYGDDAPAKAAELLALEDTVPLFTPGELMWSKYCVVTSVDFYPLQTPYSDDIAIINLIAIDNIILGDYMRFLNGNYVETIDGKKMRKKIRGLE